MALQIIVVEDDPGMGEALERVLSAAGFRVAVYPSAEALLESAAAAGAACFVFDIHLPGLSGLELRRRLTADGHRAPVIFITAHDDRATRAQAAALGAAAYLPKPFRGTDLLRAISGALKVDSLNAVS